MQQQGLCVKLRNLTTSILFLKLCIGYQQHKAFNANVQLSASVPSLEQPFSICPISFNLILQQDNYDLHLTHEPLSPPRVNTKTFGERSFSYAGPSVWNNLPQTLRHSDSTSCFKAALKTHLFNNYF